MGRFERAVVAALAAPKVAMSTVIDTARVKFLSIA
jgi:hypothetical protein